MQSSNRPSTAVTLFNQRLIIRILAICDTLRTEGKKGNFGVMHPEAPAAKMIAYLESDAANALKSVDDVINTLDTSETESREIIPKLREYVFQKRLSQEAIAIGGMGGRFDDVDTAKEAAEKVLSTMEQQHRVFFDKVTKKIENEMEKDPSSSYENLVKACARVQKYILKRNLLFRQHDKAIDKATKMQIIRKKLKKGLLSYGEIGECLNETIGHKVALFEEDSQAGIIRAIFTYSKYVALERECIKNAIKVSSIIDASATIPTSSVLAAISSTASTSTASTTAASSSVSSTAPLPPLYASSSSSSAASPNAAVILLNKRLIIEILAICEEFRKKDKEGIYGVVDPKSPASKMITYLESPEANAAEPIDKVIDYIAGVTSDTEIQMILKKLIASESKFINEAKQIAASGGSFAGVDSAKAAEEVKKIMKSQHVLGRGRDKREESFVEGFIEGEMKLTPLKAYKDLVTACSLVKDYIELRNYIFSQTDKAAKAAIMQTLRDQLQNDLLLCGPIGECFNDPKTIGHKPKLFEIDSDKETIRAIFAYSKHAALEMGCRFYKDPIKANEAVFSFTTTAIPSSVSSASSASSGNNDLLTSMQQVSPYYYVAAIQAGIDILNGNDWDLSRFFQNGLNRSSNKSKEDQDKKRDELIKLMTVYLISNHPPTPPRLTLSEIKRQLEFSLQIADNAKNQMMQSLQNNQQLAAVCNQLYGTNAAGQSNFTEDNLLQGIDLLKKLACQGFAGYDQFLNKVIMDTGYQVPNNTTCMKVTANNPIEWLKQGYFVNIGQALLNSAQNDSDKMQAQLFDVLNSYIACHCRDNPTKSITQILLATDTKVILEFAKKRNEIKPRLEGLFAKIGIDRNAVAAVFPSTSSLSATASTATTTATAPSSASSAPLPIAAPRTSAGLFVLPPSGVPKSSPPPSDPPPPLPPPPKPKS